jgi:hypothetical protein
MHLIALALAHMSGDVTPDLALMLLQGSRKTILNLACATIVWVIIEWGEPVLLLAAQADAQKVGEGECRPHLKLRAFEIVERLANEKFYQLSHGPRIVLRPDSISLCWRDYGLRDCNAFTLLELLFDLDVGFQHVVRHLTLTMKGLHDA